jgi:Protein of unknown function (DUF3102)
MQAAQDAGLSRDQAKTALRVSNVPREEFEKRVDSDNPPTIVEIGRKLVEVKGRVGHGRYTAFVTDRLGWSPQAALNFSRVLRAVRQIHKDCGFRGTDDRRELAIPDRRTVDPGGGPGGC